MRIITHNDTSTLIRALHGDISNYHSGGSNYNDGVAYYGNVLDDDVNGGGNEDGVTSGCTVANSYCTL